MKGEGYLDYEMENGTHVGIRFEKDTFGGGRDEPASCECEIVEVVMPDGTTVDAAAIETQLYDKFLDAVYEGGEAVYYDEWEAD
uniref:Uncharacterized protein n=1 Tax=viral metagenome TaxID=1070528 RepID=A0A6M3LP61_9ZZZZ